MTLQKVTSRQKVLPSSFHSHILNHFIHSSLSRYSEHPRAAGHPVPSGSGCGGSSPGRAGRCWEAAGPSDPRGGSLPGEDVRRLEGPRSQLKPHANRHYQISRLEMVEDRRIGTLSASLLAVVHKYHEVQSDR